MSEGSWIAQAMGMKNPLDDEELREKEVVILVNGRNVHNDIIYCYLKIPLKYYPVIREKLENGDEFNLRDFGEVVAAGTGDPSDEIKEEMAREYDMITVENKAPPAPPPSEDDDGFGFDNISEDDLPF